MASPHLEELKAFLRRHHVVGSASSSGDHTAPQGIFATPGSSRRAAIPPGSPAIMVTAPSPARSATLSPASAGRASVRAALSEFGRHPLQPTTAPPAALDASDLASIASGHSGASHAAASDRNLLGLGAATPRRLASLAAVGRSAMLAPDAPISTASRTKGCRSTAPSSPGALDVNRVHVPGSVLSGSPRRLAPDRVPQTPPAPSSPPRLAAGRQETVNLAAEGSTSVLGTGPSLLSYLDVKHAAAKYRHPSITGLLCAPSASAGRLRRREMRRSLQFALDEHDAVMAGIEEEQHRRRESDEHLYR